MFKTLPCCLVAALAAALISPAQAVVTYRYSGHNGPNSEGTSAYPYVPLLGSMSFDFTLAAPLAANLVAADITSSVLGWTATGGTARSTITSADANPYAGQIAFRDLVRLSTDGGGNITSFRILVAGVVAAEPDTEAFFLWERAASSQVVSDTFEGYSLSRGGSAFVSAVCTGTGGCAGATTFGISSAVPEPAGWMLWLSALGVGAAARSRRR